MPRPTVHYARVKQLVEGALDGLSRSINGAAMGGDVSRIDQQLAMALREAADLLDHPRRMGDPAGYLHELEQHLEAIRRGVPNRTMDYLRGDDLDEQIEKADDLLISLVVRDGRRDIGQVTAGWIRACAGEAVQS